MSHTFNDGIEPLTNLFVFAEMGLATATLQQIDDKHIFNISKPVAGTTIVGIPISTGVFQKLFYGTVDDEDVDGISFDSTKKATKFSLAIPSTIKGTVNGELIKKYYNLSLVTDGKYAWNDTEGTVAGLHFEEKALPTWMHDMGCMDEDNLSMSSLVRLKQELHSGETINCGSYDIYGYKWGEFEYEYKKQTGVDFSVDTQVGDPTASPPIEAGTGANVALDIMLSNSNSLAKNILLRISFTVTATGV